MLDPFFPRPIREFLHRDPLFVAIYTAFPLLEECQEGTTFAHALVRWNKVVCPLRTSFIAPKTPRGLSIRPPTTPSSP